MTDALIVEAALRTMRAVVMVTGGLVTLDALAVWFSPVERPPHRPRLNALAWGIAGLASSLIGAWLLWGGNNIIGADNPTSQQWPIAALWGAFATAFTIRAASRSHRPKRIVALSAGIAVSMFTVALLDAGLA